MFEEFSEYLTVNIKNEDFWYDYACCEANNMLLRTCSRLKNMLG